MEGVEMDVVEAGLESLPVEVVVPSLVKQELVRKYRQAIHQHRTASQNAADKLRGLLVGPASIMKHALKFDEDGAVREYEAALDSRMAELQVVGPGHDDIPHSDVLARLFSERKPFKTNGAGYRDSLIWEVILRKVAPTAEATIFVTDNKKDFALPQTNPPSLHPDLLADLEGAGLQPDSVVIRPSLEEFVNRDIKPRLEELAALRDQIEKSESEVLRWNTFFQGNFDDFVKKLQKKAEDREEELSQSWRIDVSGIYVASAGDPEKTEPVEARRLDEERVLVSAIAEVECELEFCVYKSDGACLPEDHPVRIHDFDWNEGMSSAGATVLFEAQLEFIIDTTENAVADWDITYLYPTWPRLD